MICKRCGLLMMCRGEYTDAYTLDRVRVYRCERCYAMREVKLEAEWEDKVDWWSE